ncbi:MAG: flagellar export protein FliJ [candidate division Zixibacteria bacterium]|nr:flagellar export protein FliJ [candidate division Zixibacteria bacterium]
MKRFHFRFEKVLSYRRHQERQKQRDLAAAEHLRQKQEQKIAATKEERIRRQREQSRMLTGKVDPRRLSGYTRYFLLLKQRELADRETLGRLLREVERRRGDLIEAAKQRKTYEKLEERHRQRFEAESNLLLQKETDDLGQKMHWRKT